MSAQAPANASARQMAELHARAHAPGDRPWSAAEFAGLAAPPHGIAVLEPQGFALGRQVADEAELLMIAVAPEARRRGLGQALLARFEAAARDRGAARAFLEVAAGNRPARALYAAAGWREAGLRRGYYRRANGPAEDAIVMEKSLRPLS